MRFEKNELTGDNPLNYKKRECKFFLRIYIPDSIDLFSGCGNHLFF